MDTIQRLVMNEGIRLIPYRCTAGKLTIGVGRCLDTNPLTTEEKDYIGHDGTKPITKDQAFYLLRHDIERVKKEIDSAFPWWLNLNPDRQYVLIDMVFQLGMAGVKKFKKFLGYFSVGNWEKAAEELIDSLYAKQTPARAERNKMCVLTGVYKV